MREKSILPVSSQDVVCFTSICWTVIYCPCHDKKVLRRGLLLDYIVLLVGRPVPLAPYYHRHHRLRPRWGFHPPPSLAAEAVSSLAPPPLTPRLETAAEAQLPTAQRQCATHCNANAGTSQSQTTTQRRVKEELQASVLSSSVHIRHAWRWGLEFTMPLLSNLILFFLEEIKMQSQPGPGFSNKSSLFVSLMVIDVASAFR